MNRKALVIAFGVALFIFGVSMAGYTLFFDASRDGSSDNLSSLESFEQRLAVIEGRLEKRLANLERDLAILNSPRTGSPETNQPEESPDQDPAEGDEAGDEPITAVYARLDVLERRIKGLEEDPIQRGFYFIDSENAELRRQGIYTLERIAAHDEEARIAIREMLQDPDGKVRWAALDTLADIGDKASSEAIMALLSDPSDNIRGEAINSLGRLGSKEAAPLIAQLLEDSDEGVRTRAADTLGRLKSPEVAAALMNSLNDSNDRVRGEAIASLGEIGSREALPKLMEMYDKNPGNHRIRLIMAMKNLGNSQPYNTEKSRLSERALSGDNEGARRDAIRTLSWFAARESQDIFKQALEDPSRRVRYEAERALRNLKR